MLVFAAFAMFLVRRRQRQSAVGKGGDKHRLPLLEYAAPVAPAVDASGGSGGGGATVASGRRRGPLAYSYAELSQATGCFVKKNLLDEGAFGAVYRGKLQPSGTVVAIKVLKVKAGATIVSKAAEEFVGAGGFRKEIEVLSQYHHINIVRLLGHCLSDAPQEPQCLVLEFLEGGSLTMRLAVARVQRTTHGGGKAANATAPPLTAQQRFDIASDVARALEYLHVDADPPVIHQDIKSANILLCLVQGRLLAKVADFGTARFAPKLLTDTHHATCNVVGTGPYMPLEYSQMGHVSEKTDTYAFGIVLCELLTGEGPSNFEKGEMLSQKMYEPLQDAERELPPLLDGSAGAWPLPRATALGRIARSCIEMAVAKRCLVADVLPQLDEIAGRQAVVRCYATWTQSNCRL
jgi:serine/threonine protein kinase